MKIKVQCPCGSRFEFEVEPVNGRMPVTIACPTCGADATELANVVIEHQAAGTPAATTPGLRISKSHTAPAAPAAQNQAAAAESGSAGALCPKHKSEPAVEVCCVCGKPICLKCMEQFGHVCSVYCRQQATHKRIYVPVYARQKIVVAGKSQALVKLITGAVVVVVLLLIGFWTWYAWFARTPKVVYSLSFPKRDVNTDKRELPGGFENGYYRLIGPGQLLILKNNHLSLFDIKEQKQIWSAALQSEEQEAANKAAHEKNEEIIRITPKVFDEGMEVTHYAGLDPLGDADFFLDAPEVIVTTNDIWLCTLPNYVLRFDRKTGNPKEVGIKDKIVGLNPLNDNAILVFSRSSGASETLTKITLSGGSLQSEEIPIQPKNLSTGGSSASKTKTIKPSASVDKIPVGQLKNLASQPAKPEQPAEDAYDAMNQRSDYLFHDAGPNVVEFTTKLLEYKTIAHAAMKAKGKSVLDDGNLTASQGLEVAQEMMNDSRREQTGGVEEENVSRFQVTLHRCFEKDAPDWRGEVSGPPSFFPLKTVDVLAAGQNIYVFDKHNKKLWEAKMTFPVRRYLYGLSSPCLETSDAFYVADLGILTRYDLATGTVRWRYNSVGISHIQADKRGALYLDTTSAGPESIQYSQQINLKDRIHPVIVKLAPETGKVLWRIESVGDHALLSGKFLYSTRVSSSQAALRLEEGPDTHYNLKLLDPATGNEIWNFHRMNQKIIRTEVQDNWIMVQFEDEVVVLKFFSL